MDIQRLQLLAWALVMLTLLVALAIISLQPPKRTYQCRQCSGVFESRVERPCPNCKGTRLILISLGGD